MLESKTILIFDGGVYSALDLSDAIERSDGRVAGPVATLGETLAILNSTTIGGAVIDCELDDADQVVTLLSERSVPVVGQVSGPVLAGSRPFHGHASILVRPVDPRTILACLLVEMGRLESRISNTLGAKAKQV